jgi:hypothetical protein
MSGARPTLLRVLNSRSTRLLALTGLGIAALLGLDLSLADDQPAPAPAPQTAPPPPLATESPPAEPTHFAEAPEPEASTPAETAEEVPAEPAEAANSDRDERVENVVEAKQNKWIPAYQQTRPSWGVAMTGSLGAFGNASVSTSAAEGVARAIELQGEYQFPFLQAIGVISMGPSAVLYPFTPSESVTKSAISVWSVGGQVRYQARFFREQILVPMVGYEAQRLAYSFNDGSAGSAILKGPVFGGMLLLNIFEPSSASEFYIDQGVSRSYLVGEYKNLAGSDGVVTVAGASIFFGLRFEF